MAVLAVVALAAVGMGNGGVDVGGVGGTERSPRPGQRAQYAVKFEDSGGQWKPVPEPWVSYPIRFTPQGGEQ
ncbi:hypothetical protein [Streptomyces sp. NPDC055099]